MTKAQSKTAPDPEFDEDLENLPSTIQYAPKRIPIEKIIELRQKGLSQPQIAKILGCHHSNISRRLAPVAESIDNTQLFIDHRAIVLAYEQNRIRQYITPAKLEKANLRDLIWCLAVLYDKERLESGLSTSNIAYMDMIKARQGLDGKEGSLQAEKAKLVEQIEGN